MYENSRLISSVSMCVCPLIGCNQMMLLSCWKKTLPVSEIVSGISNSKKSVVDWITSQWNQIDSLRYSDHLLTNYFYNLTSSCFVKDSKDFTKSFSHMSWLSFCWLSPPLFFPKDTWLLFLLFLTFFLDDDWYK